MATGYAAAALFYTGEQIGLQFRFWFEFQSIFNPIGSEPFSLGSNFGSDRKFGSSIRFGLQFGLQLEIPYSLSNESNPNHLKFQMRFYMNQIPAKINCKGCCLSMDVEIRKVNK